MNYFVIKMIDVYIYIAMKIDITYAPFKYTTKVMSKHLT